MLGHISPKAVLGPKPADIDDKSQHFKFLFGAVRAGVRRVLFQLSIDFHAKIKVSKAEAAIATIFAVVSFPILPNSP